MNELVYQEKNILKDFFVMCKLKFEKFKPFWHCESKECEDNFDICEI
jgi:hypothetical protein